MAPDASLKPAFDAVACYDLPEDLGVTAVADFRTVIGSLSTTGVGPFTPRNLALYLDDDMLKTCATELSLLTGRDPAGLTIAIALVTDDAGHKFFMPVIGDTVEKKTLAICPAGLPPGPAEAARAAGVTYVIADQQDATTAINNFFSGFALARQAKGKPLPVSSQEFMLYLLKTLSMAADFSASPVCTPIEGPQGVQEIKFRAGLSPADLLLSIARGEAPVCLYTAAVKPGASLQGRKSPAFRL